MSTSWVFLAVTTVWAGWSAVASPVAAQSALRLTPADPRSLEARTFDQDGAPLGASMLSLEQISDGRVSFNLRIGVSDVVRATTTALLRIDESGFLRPETQASTTFDVDGHPELSLEIDHVARRARCSDRAGVRELPLPKDDRIANSVLPLLVSELEPAGRREFQFLLCRGGPRLLDAVARSAALGSAGFRQVEVEFVLPAPLRMAARLLPTTTFWIRPDTPFGWVGHRAPLGGAGMPVVVVRTPLTPRELR